jgi:Zn-dependent protease with chaperone function
MPAAIDVHFFDGRSSRAQPCALVVADQQVHLIRAQDGAVLHRIPVQSIQWPERTRHGVRIAQLPGGAQVHAVDSAAWDAWAAVHVPHAQNLVVRWVVRAQQSWRGVVLAFALLLAVLGAFYVWGLPLAARGVTSLVPLHVDAMLGNNAMEQMDGRWMQPSTLPRDVQERLTQRFAQAVQTAHPGQVQLYTLLFRKSKIGPNAFALPGGTMVLTDELVTLVNDDNVVLGVLGHELGHVTQRHSMRQLVQVGVMQAVLSLAFGDYGTLVTTAPLILGSMAYSRDAEREADAASIQFMHANKISPLVMVKFFETMRAQQKTKTQKTPLGISIISSHPADEERMQRFRAAVRPLHP